MNSTTRLLVIVLANFILVAGMLYRLSCSGIDIEHSKLIDNADNLSFVFDFVSFLLMLFFVNAALLIYPSNKSSSLKRIIKALELRKQENNIPAKRSRKHLA
jgi:hypothetical protein